MVKINSLPIQFRKKSIIEKIQNLCEANGITFMALFGSFVRKQQKGRSDLDVLIKFDANQTKSLIDLIHAESEMQKIFHRKVDLLTMDSLSPYLKNDILHSMKVVYEK